MPDEPQASKIIIDEDWKEQAQREKEMLADALEREKTAKQAFPEKVTFPLLATGLATQALFAMGEIEHPATKKKELNLPEAKFHIDMLEMLEQKTKGNLSPEETQMMTQLLFDLRMKFVSASKQGEAK